MAYIWGTLITIGRLRGSMADRKTLKVPEDTYDDLNAAREARDMSWPGFLRSLLPDDDGPDWSVATKEDIDRLHDRLGRIEGKANDEYDLRSIVREEVRDLLESTRR